MSLLRALLYDLTGLYSPSLEYLGVLPKGKFRYTRYYFGQMRRKRQGK
jgi:hypothetical protein